MDRLLKLTDEVFNSSWAFPNWSYRMIPLFSIFIFFSLEMLSIMIPPIFVRSNKLPIKSGHLDEFDHVDKLYIFINKLLTIIFAYHLIHYCYYTPSIKWNINEATLQNTIGSFLLCHIIYDFFYMNFHRILHIRALYPYVHKQHHKQNSPSRGNLDGINAHPFEYLMAEYFHLLTIWIIPCQHHIITVGMFLFVGAFIASLNHTRYDITIPFGIYSVKCHDVHHRLPENNFGQYSMFWDYIFGTYRDYDDLEDKAK